MARAISSLIWTGARVAWWLQLKCRRAGTGGGKEPCPALRAQPRRVTLVRRALSSAVPCQRLGLLRGESWLRDFVPDRTEAFPLQLAARAPGCHGARADVVRS
jgi:hypothetical protein